ncbi:microtubule-associated protein 1 [Sesamum alatum]|uniref:Microtubule-associated protein 1 n=1 Tax=Sesamum alatum TaxID=300844 RepID=A0AAE2CY22_9LAMI|nr:microtubule-associated protein 1 [Sesamum alatum]
MYHRFWHSDSALGLNNRGKKIKNKSHESAVEFEGFVKERRSSSWLECAEDGGLKAANVTGPEGAPVQDRTRERRTRNPAGKNPQNHPFLPTILPEAQDLGTTLIQLWSLMDMPIEEQRRFDHVTCLITLTADEVSSPLSLSIDAIKQAETEVECSNVLKASKKKELIFKRQSELEEIYEGVHMDVDSDKARVQVRYIAVMLFTRILLPPSPKELNSAAAELAQLQNSNSAATGILPLASSVAA